MDQNPEVDGSAYISKFEELMRSPPTLPPTPNSSDDHQIPNNTASACLAEFSLHDPELLESLVNDGYSLPVLSWSSTSWKTYLNETLDDHDAVGQSSSPHLSPTVKKKRSYKRFREEDIRKLIQGVEKFGRSWIEIEAEYFQGSGRTKDQLKEKWRDMLIRDADKQTDIPMKELYTRVKMVNARVGSDPQQSREKNQRKNKGKATAVGVKY